MKIFKDFRDVLNMSTYILWYVDPLLVNDSEISTYTTAVAKYQLRKHIFLHGNNCTATEERCFLRGPCRDVRSRASSLLQLVEQVGW
jgi:hypothetical protein